MTTIGTTSRPLSTPLKSYVQQQANYSYRQVTPPTSSETSSSSGQRTHRSASISTAERAHGRNTVTENDELDAFFGMWPLVSTSNAIEDAPSRVEAGREPVYQAVGIKKSVTFSPLKPRRRQDNRSKLVSIDTPMHRQLQIHLQHYLKDDYRGMPDE
jgi:hypothetical protein